MLTTGFGECIMKLLKIGKNFMKGMYTNEKE